MIRQLTYACLCMLHLINTSTGQRDCSMTRPCELKGGEPLRQCQHRVSSDGFLDITLNVEAAIFKFDWLELPRRSYNGQSCPSTWRVQRGDVIKVNLVNKLSDNNPKGKHNWFGSLNSTNLHTHGLHISPKVPHDNVFVEVKPGESFQYLFTIEKDHMAGTFWYHPHQHGAVAIQNGGGMAGILIVEDDPNVTPAELNAVSCPNNCQHDLSFIFSSTLEMKTIIPFQRGSGDYLRLNNTKTEDGEILEDWLLKNVNYMSVNGQLHPTLFVAKGQLKRFRLLHAGMRVGLELELVHSDKNKITTCEVREISLDGVYLDKPRVLKYGQTFLAPANRVDWLVRCDTPGKYELRSTPRDLHSDSFGGYPRFPLLLATIEVIEFETELINFPVTLPERPHYITDLRNVEPDRVMVIELGEAFTMNREQWTGPTDYRYRFEEGDVIDVQLISTVPEFSHPIHIHMNHFQIISYEPYIGPWILNKFGSEVRTMYDQKSGDACFYQYQGYSGEVPDYNLTNPLKYLGHDKRWKEDKGNTLAYAQAGEWRDTIFCPALGNITLRIKLHKFDGPMLVHCHLLEDSDMGMMMVIDVVKKGELTSGARESSAGAYPGSCNICDWNVHREVPKECSEIMGGFFSDNLKYALLVIIAALLLLAVAAKM